MPLYKFQCTGCGERAMKEMSFEEHDETMVKGEHELTLPFFHEREVDGMMRLCGAWAQVFDFVFKRGTPDHYNHTVDAYVTGERDFNNKLKMQSDAMSERMGFTVDYEVIDPGEPEAYGVTQDGIEETERRAVAEGRKEVKLWL